MISDFRRHGLDDLRKFGFSKRVFNTWNSLANWVVSAYTTDTFKARLDKFWHSQDIVYVYATNQQQIELGLFWIAQL